MAKHAVRARTQRTQRVIGAGDMHWSDRDLQAIAVFEAAQRRFKPDCTVIGGDLLNCSPFSRHPKTKLSEDVSYDLLETELEPAAAFLKRLARHTKHLAMLEGNHDEWIERWIRNCDVGRAFRSLLPSAYLGRGLTPRDWTYVPFTKVAGDRTGRFKLHPKLFTVHGWAANKYAAERHLTRAHPYSVIFHHTHRIESRIQTSLDGKSSGAWSAGCLCKRVPTYAHGGCPTEWSHGFWVAYIGRRSFQVYTVPILQRNHAVLPDGSEIRA